MPNNSGWQRIAVLLMVLCIALGALAFRMKQLDLRPFHLDEGVQAVKTGELYDSGHYRYDPAEFHGPSLYYLTVPFLKLSGATSFAETHDEDFRQVPVYCGVAIILALLLLRSDLGGIATLTAACLIAVSPAMVFYSRYYIQEMLLVLFAALALGALWRYDCTRSKRWAALFGLAIGLMYATKETSVIFCGGMAVAYGVMILRRRFQAGRSLWEIPCLLGNLWLVIGIAALVAGLFFTSFLDHPRGLLDSVLAYRQYLVRSGGDGSAALHQQPWYYYLKLLAYTKDAAGPWWSEGLILALAAVGLTASLRQRLPAAIHPDLALFLAIYALLMTVAFAMIPYKTPWNLLGFHHGLILLAGIGAAAVVNWFPKWPWKLACGLLLAAGIGQLAAQSGRTNFRFCADPRNPYVYAHSVPDVVRLAQRIDEVSALTPEGRTLRIHFITADYWPMPYYLRAFNQIGYWEKIPASPDAPILVVNADLQEQLDPLLRDSYHTAFYGLRRDVLLVLYIRQDLWDRYLEMKNGRSEISPGNSK